MSDPTTSGGLHAPELRDDREDAALGCDDQTFRRKMLNPLNLRGRLRYSFSACRAHYLNGFFHAMPDVSSTPAAISPERPIPCRRCTATLLPSSSAVAIVLNKWTASRVDANTPRSGFRLCFQTVEPSAVRRPSSPRESPLQNEPKLECSTLTKEPPLLP